MKTIITRKEIIRKTLEKQYNSITTSLYPADACARIINTPSSRDKKIAFDWLNEKGILFNANNY